MKIAARHDAILRSLRRRGLTTVDALASETGCSRRTIIRDIGALREQGFVIQSDPGRGGGLQLDPGSVQLTARLSVAEVFALLLCVATIRAGGTLPFSALADSGLARIERSLPPDRLRDLRRLLDCLHVGTLSPLQDLSDLGPVDPALLPAFEQAFLERQHLRFRYRDARLRETLREVEPQAMLVLPPLWYLVGWDPARGDFRRFRMDRIAGPTPLPGTAFRPRHVPFEDDVCPYTAQTR
jgi:predicted DNA-binding transcriptional regulator YafY